jgi:tight adherence protein B
MTILLVATVFVGTFALATAAVFGGRRLFDDRDDAPTQLIGPESAIDWDTPVIAPQLLKGDALSTISVWDRLLANVDGIELMKSRLAEAGIAWSVGRLTAMMLLAGTATFAILWKMSWIPGVASVCVAFGAGSLPYLLVARRRSKRLRQFEEEFPEALDSLARAVRAGNPFSAGMELLVRETPQPLAGEIKRTLDERNFGANWDQALANLAQRIPIEEVSLFVAAVQLQSRTGGKLHEVLTKLAENMRESSALKGEVRAIAAHARLTGLILTLLPVGIAGVMAVVNPSHILILWTDETGRTMVSAALCGLVAAHFVMRKLLDIRL